MNTIFLLIIIRRRHFEWFTGRHFLIRLLLLLRRKWTDSACNFSTSLALPGHIFHVFRWCLRPEIWFVYLVNFSFSFFLGGGVGGNWTYVSSTNLDGTDRKSMLWGRKVTIDGNVGVHVMSRWTRRPWAEPNPNLNPTVVVAAAAPRLAA